MRDLERSTVILVSYNFISFNIKLQCMNKILSFICFAFSLFIYFYFAFFDYCCYSFSSFICIYVQINIQLWRLYYLRCVPVTTAKLAKGGQLIVINSYLLTTLNAVKLYFVQEEMKVMQCSVLSYPDFYCINCILCIY